MSRWRGWLLVGVSVVAALGVIWLLWRMYSRFGAEDAKIGHKEVTASWTLVGAWVGLLVPGLRAVWHSRNPADPRATDMLADMLAQAVRGQWRKAAIERRLVTPAPIPVGWSLSDLPVGGPVEAGVGSPGVTPAFPPLPGQTRVTEEQLRVGGGRGELFAVYAGIASGRMIVVGAPGAGKTGTAILLLLDALAHRDHAEDKDRVRVPVPVLFTAHGWDPTTCSAQDWLAERLVTDYPLFQHRGDQVEASKLVADGAVALFLDGLDEMDVARRSAALAALSDAPFRVVVLTRSQEMVEAADAVWLVGAVVVQLHDISGPVGADYLQGARNGPAPAGWTQFLAHLRETSDSALTRGLSTPLALTLVRDTYRTDDDIGELCDVARRSAADDVERHLIARVLRDAYSSRPGWPEPRYSMTQARQVLTFLARQMDRDHTRDLAWWHIPRWVPTSPRILVTLLMIALTGQFLIVLSSLLPPDGFDLKGALVFGLTFQLPIAFSAWFAGRLTAGAARKLAPSVTVGLGRGQPQRQTSAMNWRAFRSCPVLLAALTAGLVGGLVAGLVWGLQDVFDPTLYPHVGPGARLVSGFMEGLLAGWAVLTVAAWLAVAVAAGLSRTETSEGSPLGPKGNWRHDRRAGLVGGLVFGIAIGLAFGFLSGFVEAGDPIEPDKPWFALVVGLVFGLAFCVGAGLPFYLGAAQTWQTTLAWLQLQRSHQVPRVALMPFSKTPGPEVSYAPPERCTSSDTQPCKTT